MEEIFKKGGVSGYLHRPASETGNGLVLTHGAGGNAKMPLLASAAAHFCQAGWTVLRCDLPFRQKRQNGAPHPSGAAADRAGLYEAAQCMREIASGPVVLGGQSYGGRQATMLCAEDPSAADGLLLFSYPLHPPGRTDQKRTAHFPALRTQAVFIHGTRDPFGAVEDLRAALTLIPADTRLIVIDGAGHDLKRGRFDLDAVVRECSSQHLPRS